MDTTSATRILESLSCATRLDLYRLLVRQGTSGLVAGQIAQALGIPPTNLSFHLKAMVHAGLLTVEQEGRFQRYRADLALMVSLIGYLTDECCAGHPEQCTGLPSLVRGASRARRPLRKVPR